MSVERAVWLLIEAVEAMSQVYVQRLPESDRTVLEKVYAARDVLDGLPDPFASRSSAERDDPNPDADPLRAATQVIHASLGYAAGNGGRAQAIAENLQDAGLLVSAGGPGTEWQDDPEGSGRQYPVVPDAGTEGDPIPCPHCDGVGYVQDRTDEAIPAPLSYEGLKRAQAVAEAANEARHNTVDDASLDPMRCVYCNKPCDDRPVRHEAVCWDCSTDNSSFRVERSADDVSPDTELAGFNFDRDRARGLVTKMQADLDSSGAEYDQGDRYDVDADELFDLLRVASVGLNALAGHSAPSDDACLAADWAKWALDSLAIALGRLEALGQDYPPDYEQLDRQARNVVAAIRDRQSTDKKEYRNRESVE